jgi:fibrillarin-like pre-rRNA processing protein
VRARRAFVPDRRSPRLLRAQIDDRTELFTESVGSPPPVYGERWLHDGRRSLRAFEPGRSKLSAGIVRAWTGPIPSLGDSWLYLGAATGTTASHVADLVGPEGRVYAVERSPRPFARLLALAQRWPNLLPILADARESREFSALVPQVQGVYADIAQPDQVAIVRANAELFLSGRGAGVVLALKTASMGRERDPAGHLAVAERELADTTDLVPSVRLDPFHRGHFLVGGRYRTGPPARGRPLRITGSRAARPVRRSR